jgi:flagellum-specific peptidoglycan hydrolase FlgJ
MIERQINALRVACREALKVERTSSLSPNVQRALTIVSVCQFCLESATPPKRDGSGGWFTSMLSQPPVNNPFGIKKMQKYEEYGEFSEDSWEISNGSRVQKEEVFQKFPDLATAFKAHQELLCAKPQVQAALTRQDWIAIAAALGPPIDELHCGYSTNPAYAKILAMIGSEAALDDPGKVEWYAGAAPAQE